jgi:hypothetical protein
MPTSLLTTPVDELPTKEVEAFIRRLALLHGITAKRTALDDWADKVTELCGDEVRLNEISQLLVNLKRAHVLSSAQMARLVASHFRERKALGLPY